MAHNYVIVREITKLCLTIAKVSRRFCNGYLPSISSRLALNSLPGFHSGSVSAFATR
jgi:hypothetical protein